MDGYGVNSQPPLVELIAPKANCGMTSTRIAACLQNEEGFSANGVGLMDVVTLISLKLDRFL